VDKRAEFVHPVKSVIVKVKALVSS